MHTTGLPLRTRIQARLTDGTALKMTLNKPRGSAFGLSPAETTGSAAITFAPGSAKASMVLPQFGSWDAVEISLETP